MDTDFLNDYLEKKVSASYRRNEKYDWSIVYSDKDKHFYIRNQYNFKIVLGETTADCIAQINNWFPLTNPDINKPVLKN